MPVYQPTDKDIDRLSPELRRRAARANARIRTAQKALQARYLNDPVAWVHDCIRWDKGGGTTVYQDEILAALADKRRVCIRSLHGAAKTTTAALAIIHFAVTRDSVGADWKVPTTASAWGQLIHYLWPEVHKWIRRIRWDKVGREAFRPNAEILKLSLQLRTGSAFAMAVADPSALEGAHADELLYVFDEAKAIPDAIFDAAEGAFSTAGQDTGTNAYALALSTPGEPNGRFYDIQSHKPGTEDWWTRKITLEEAMAAGRVTEEWVRNRRLLWGETSAIYINRVLGDFASSDEDAVIPLSWVELANRRWEDLFGERAKPRDPHAGTAAVLKPGEVLHVIGADIARGGGDKTVLALRQSNAIVELRRDSYTDDLTVIAGWIGGIQDAYPSPKGKPKAIIDSDGLGVGVYDIMRAEGRPVVAYHGSNACKRLDSSGELGFERMRSFAHWNLREMLDPNAELDVAIPPDDRLTGDLVAPRWRVMSGGRIKIEEKDEIKKRIGRSPDDGDAIAMAFVQGAGGKTWADMYEEMAKPAHPQPLPPAPPAEFTEPARPEVPTPRQKPQSRGGWASIYAKPEQKGPFQR